MQTQRDHVHGHQFMVGRLASGLVLGEPSSLEVPGRRSVVGMIIGLVLGLVAVVGFGVYGLLFPGGSEDWKNPGAILVVEETGARYVYVNGKLRPALNMTSARLVQAGKNPHVELINEASIAKVPRGAPIGIAGAPQVLPDPADLLAGPWLSCLPGADVPERENGSGLAVGINMNPKAPVTPLPPDKAVLVSNLDGQVSLLLGDQRHPVADPAALVALGMSNVEPLMASQRWLELVPQGPTIGAATIPGAGESGPSIGGELHPVGQLFRHRGANGTEELFVLRSDGLAPITKVEFALLAVSAPERSPVKLRSGDVVAAPRSTDRSLNGGRLPALAGVTLVDGSGSAVCLRRQRQGKAYLNALVLADPAGAGLEPAGGPGVHMPSGSGVLAAAVPAQGQQPKSLYLITGRGVKYLIASREALNALGYGGSAMRLLPRAVLDTLPDGPTLAIRAPGMK